MTKLLKNELNVNYYQNKFGYSKLQFFVIKWWGHLGYLNYDYLPSGVNLIININKEIDLYLKAIAENDDQQIDEFNDWLGEGAKIGKKYFMTKNVVDELLISCQKGLDRQIMVYKTGEIESNNHRWVSVTTEKNSYRHMSGVERSYTLHQGTPVIFADGIADQNEIIINSSYLINTDHV